jgi:hypothetical protein
VTSKQYLGDPIDCIVEEIPQAIMDTYCWIHSTYSVTNMIDGEPGHDVAHPGVAPPNTLDETGEYRYHKYYQWVCFTLFFQAIMFYIPRYIWKAREGGLMKMLTAGMTVPIVDKEAKEKHIKQSARYFTNEYRGNKTYFWEFYFCEILNLINVIGQIFFTDLFLGGEFTQYGGNVLEMSELPPEDRTDPMALVFPKVTKCTFHKFGPSGTVELFDGLCILPLNIINEKIYIFLWFWFIVVSILTGLALIYRITVILIPKLRQTLLGLRAKNVDPYKIQEICSVQTLTDWFMIYQMGKNMDPLIFNSFLEELYNQIKGKYGEDERKPLK